MPQIYLLSIKYHNIHLKSVSKPYREENSPDVYHHIFLKIHNRSAILRRHADGE